MRGIMRGKHFELWLDESGDFQKDDSYIDNPSIVAGVLVEKGTMSLQDAEKLCKGRFIHGNEFRKGTFGPLATEILGKVKENGASLVVFENKERLRIVDGDTTYLNVMAEGIIQLYQSLNFKYGKVKLDIIAAVRLNMSKQQERDGQIIEKQEYSIRLQERMILGLARRNLTMDLAGDWTFTLASARRDFRLMIADVVSHAWYRRHRKCTQAEVVLIDRLFGEGYYFTVIEDGSVSAVRSKIIDGDLGSAIFMAYSYSDNIGVEDAQRMVVEQFQDLNDIGRQIQLQALCGKLKLLIDLHGNIAVCKRVIKNIQKGFLAQLSDTRLVEKTFLMDLNLYMYAVSTREGDIPLAEQLAETCEELLMRLPKTWDTLTYYFIFHIRRAVHLMGMGDYEGCIRITSGLITTLEDMLTVPAMSHGLSGVFDTIKSEELGKVLGTRLQARIHLIPRNKEQILLARADSNKAINEFSRESDVRRQKQYRCWLEYTAENYQEAANWLWSSYFIEDLQPQSWKNFWEMCFTKATSVEKSYTLLHYVSIMSATFIDGSKSLSDEMFAAWNVFLLQINELLVSHNNQEPYDKIFWKLGVLMQSKGNVKAALGKFDTAILICDINKEKITFSITKLKVITSKTLCLLTAGEKYRTDFRKNLKYLVEYYNELLQNDHLWRWREAIKDLEPIVIDLAKEKEHEKIIIQLQKLSMMLCKL